MAGSGEDQPSSSKPGKAAPSKKPAATALNLLGNMQRTVIEGLVKATSATSNSRKPAASKQPTEKAATKHVSLSIKPPTSASKHGSPSIKPPPSSKAPSSIPPPPAAKPSTQASKSAPSNKPSTKVSKPALPMLVPSSHSKAGPSRLSPASNHPSILKTKHDIEMASRQPTIDALSPAEKTKQEKWAQGQLKMHGKTCPVNLDWERTKDGYKCEGGFHVVTHQLLAEGKGGMMFDYSLHDKKGRGKWIGPLYGQDIEDATFQEGKYKKWKFS